MSKKNKKTVVKGKVYKVDMNIEVEDLNAELLYYPIDQEQREEYASAVDAWAGEPQETRGTRPRLVREKMDGPEFFKDIIMKSINMTHSTGNTGSLRRTKAIGDILDVAVEEKKGKLEIMEEDFKYMNSALNKSDKWNNTEDTARGILRVADALNDAENEHSKSPAGNEEIEGGDGAE